MLLIAALAVSSGCSLPFSKKEESVRVQTEGELSMDSVLMRVGNIGVTYREILIYMYQMKERYEPGFGKEVWNFPVEEGKTFGEYAKEEVLDNITQIKVIVQQAEKDGVVLEEDELSEIEEQAKEYLSGITSRDIKRYGLTEELIEAVYQDNRLAERMYDITTSVVDTDISDQEARQISLQYFAVLTDGTDRNGKKVKFTKKKKQQALKRAQDLRKQAKEAADFGNFADANSDLSSYQAVYGKDELSEAGLPEEILKAGLKMKTGEMSKVMTAEDGYYVLYSVSDFDEEATRQKKEQIIEKEQEKIFSEAYAGWSEQYDVELGQNLWKEITLESLGD